MKRTNRVRASIAAVSFLIGGSLGYVAGDANDSPQPSELPPAQLEPPKTSNEEPGDVVHVDPKPVTEGTAAPSPSTTEEIPATSENVPAAPDGESVAEPSTVAVGPLPPAQEEPPYTKTNEPGDVTQDGHGNHHWYDRSLVFIDYTGDKYAAALSRAAKVWNDVGARVHVFVVDGGEVRRDCGTSGTTSETIPVCLAPSNGDILGTANWGYDSSGHTVRGAINITDGITLSEADWTLPHEVGHILAFLHGGGCVMEPTYSSCDVPSSSDKTELTNLYQHGSEADSKDLSACKTFHADIHAYAQASTNLGVSVSSINNLNDALHGVGCTGTTTPSSTASDLTKCKTLHRSLHEYDEEAFRRGVNLDPLIALNDQFHAKGCTG